MANSHILRDTKIDILRCIAILCIILAHSHPNRWLFQLRNFDVVLMVLLLGNSFYLSSVNKKLNYLNYVRKRFNRLVVPTWVFLTIFFALFYLLDILTNDFPFFSYSKIIASYTLATTGAGIGYVWIMRVFFVIALVCPFLLKLSERVKDNRVYMLLLVLAYLFYELLLAVERYTDAAFNSLDFIHRDLDETIDVLYTAFFLNCVGYVLVAAVGIRLVKLSRREVIFCCLALFVILLALLYKHHFAFTQGFKYPPRLYYLAYGLYMSLTAYSLLHIQKVRKLFDNSLVLFISKTSAWLYFWHIIFIYVVKFFGDDIPLISDNWVYRFLFIFTSSLALTYIHELTKAYFKSLQKRRLQPLSAVPG
ncbi:acyltransferase family protein [Pontibacter sp. CAU 1760]